VKKSVTAPGLACLSYFLLPGVAHTWNQALAIPGDFPPGAPPRNAMATLKASISSAMNLCND
jgi:hypothetical protein